LGDKRKGGNDSSHELFIILMKKNHKKTAGKRKKERHRVDVFTNVEERHRGFATGKREKEPTQNPNKKRKNKEGKNPENPTWGPQ